MTDIQNVSLTITIESADAAMCDNPQWQIQEALRKIYHTINASSGDRDGPIKDTNGNTIGSFTFVIERNSSDESEHAA